jgi:nickel-dependent lactate racemase
MRMSNLQAEAIIASGLAKIDVAGKRLLVIIPDTTRTAPVGLIIKIIHKSLKGRIAKLDLLVALGTHQPLSWSTMLRHLDLSEEEYRRDYGDMECFNHRWDDPASLMSIGVLSANFIRELTDGLMEEAVTLTVNRLILEYDHLLIVGPVFPHEIAGFSGGSKYLFPGISGPEMINFTHWLGAVITNMKIIGRADNPVRRVLDAGAEFMPVPVSAISLVTHQGKLAGVYVGPLKDSWQQAIGLAVQSHIVKKPHPFQRVLACAPTMYDDLWTGAKCMYKCEPVVADGGELIIYAPHISSFSYTHGQILEKIGYHVRDYYLQDMERFADIPRAVMAVSAYLKGTGTFDKNIERPRIQVTLATAISPEACRKANIGYVDPESIDFSEFQEREDEGILFVERAGETLFLLENDEK